MKLDKTSVQSHDVRPNFLSINIKNPHCVWKIAVFHGIKRPSLFLPPAYVVRGKVMFSVCLSVHTRGGVPTFWMVGGGTYSQVWMEGGGTYLPRSGWGGVPTLRSGWGWVPTFPGPGGGGGYLPSGLGGTYSGPGEGGGTYLLGGGTYSGLDGGYLLR